MKGWDNAAILSKHKIDTEAMEFMMELVRLNNLSDIAYDHILKVIPYSFTIFCDKKEDILKGAYNVSLLNSITELNDVMGKIEKISIEKIYNARKVVQLEIAGFRIMSGLVEDFVTAALAPKSNREKEQKKILELLPRQFTFDESIKPYEKVMHIIDFISGMTDLYALKLYRKLRGIEL